MPECACTASSQMDTRSLPSVCEWIKQQWNIEMGGDGRLRPVSIHLLELVGYILISCKPDVDLSCMFNQLRDQLSPCLRVTRDGRDIIIKR